MMNWPFLHTSVFKTRKDIVYFM